MKRQAEGSYFGDEEGFSKPVKEVTAKVSSFECTLLRISKKKVKQNAWYQPELVIDLRTAGESKLINLQSKVQEVTEFKQRIEDFKKFSHKKMPEIRSPAMMLSQFKAKGKLHGINRESLHEMAKQGKLGRFNFDAVPFSQKACSDKLKAIDDIIDNCIPLDISEMGESRSVKKSPYVAVGTSDIKSTLGRVSSNLLLDKHFKMIRKLRNMSEKLSEHGTNDLSRSFSQSRLDTEQPEINLSSLKGSFVQKKIIINSKQQKSSRFRPTLTRAPTEELFKLDEGPKMSSRTIPNKIQNKRIGSDSLAKKIVEKHATELQPDILHMKLSPQLNFNVLPKINHRGSSAKKNHVGSASARLL